MYVLHCFLSYVLYIYYIRVCITFECTEFLTILISTFFFFLSHHIFCSAVCEQVLISNAVSTVYLILRVFSNIFAGKQVFFFLFFLKVSINSYVTQATEWGKTKMSKYLRSVISYNFCFCIFNMCLNYAPKNKQTGNAFSKKNSLVS